MTDIEILQYKKQLKKGIPEGEIKNDLKAKGVSEADIKKIFTPQKANMANWYLVSAILVLMLAIYVVAKGLVSLLIFGLSGLLFYEYYKTQQQKTKG
jgi:hypothetical protein